MGNIKYMQIHNWDNSIASTIKGKMNAAGGEINIKNGNSSFNVSYADDESGICFATPKGEVTLLPWNTFFASVDILKENNGKALKGDAAKGKLGSKALPLNSVEGYVAANVFGKKKNQMVDKNVPKIAAILKFAEIAQIGRDYIELKEEFK